MVGSLLSKWHFEQPLYGMPAPWSGTIQGGASGCLRFHFDSELLHIFVLH